MAGIEISPTKVGFIILKAREYGAKVGAWDDSATSDHDAESILEDFADDSTVAELKEFIRDLNEDEQVSLVALAWIGRGSFSPEEVSEAIDTARAVMNHPGIRVLLVTGGPGVVREAQRTDKRAICAGPGNPPVVVDQTADVERAGVDIVRGASFDNNLVVFAQIVYFPHLTLPALLQKELGAQIGFHLFKRRQLGIVVCSHAQIMNSPK